MYGSCHSEAFATTASPVPCHLVDVSATHLKYKGAQSSKDLQRLVTYKSEYQRFGMHVSFGEPLKSYFLLNSFEEP